jgi:hypothetical protein
MPANYVLLGKFVVGAAGSGGVAFQNIPQTGYTDLLIKVSGRSGTTGPQRNAIDIGLTFNGNSSGYSSKILTANPGVDNPPISVSNSGSSIVWAGEVANADSTANTFGNFDIYIPNYTSSNYKSISVDSVTENNSSNSETRFASGVWANTAAITQVTLSGGSLLQHTSFHLYGIAKLGTTPAIAPYATGGDVINTDGTYFYHAFLTTGTFTPRKGLSCDYLVVAGGGGSSLDFSSGAGAGGYRSATAQTFNNATNYTITVGAGGAKNAGTNGSNSSIAGTGMTTFSATGGGRGVDSALAGVTGGSGSGTAYSNTAVGGAGNAGSYTPVEGFKGGNGIDNGQPRATGGGGGASAAGGNASGVTNGVGGVGGAGSNAHSTWASATGTGVSGYYAGGGGGVGESGAGSAGGAGGGGQGGTRATNNAVAGTANTGGGAGGGGNNSGGGATGGSGIVIVRYPI